MTPLKKDSFIQINIVVKDIRKAAEAWAAVLGTEVPEIHETHLESFGQNKEYPYTYRGQELPCDLLTAVIPMEHFVLELHQPVTGPSSFQEFYEEHGNGVHHLGFEVGADREKVLDGLAGLGMNVDRTVGVYPGSSWTIVDSEDILGVNLNIKPYR